MLEAEMDEHLGYEKNSVAGNNSENSRKQDVCSVNAIGYRKSVSVDLAIINAISVFIDTLNLPLWCCMIHWSEFIAISSIIIICIFNYLSLCFFVCFIHQMPPFRTI